MKSFVKVSMKHEKVINVYDIESNISQIIAGEGFEKRRFRLYDSKCHITL